MTIERDALLPGYSGPFETAQSETSARLLDLDAQAIVREQKPHEASDRFVPSLAYEWSVHHPAADEATQRARVASSFEDHIAYGSPAALENEIALDAGVAISIVEWHQDPWLEWPDFLVEAVIDPGEAQPDMSAVMASAIRRKNVRDWPSKGRIRVRQPGTELNLGAACHMTSHVKIHPAEAPPPPPQIWIGGAARMMPKVKIHPLRAA